MQETNFYKLRKPDEADFIAVEDLNYNADVLDQELNNLNENKLDKRKIYRKIQWTSYREFQQRLAGHGGLKVLHGEAYLFATDENLYHLVDGSSSYSEYQFAVVPKIGNPEQNMHPMHFTKPQYYLAVVDEANPRKIVLHILTSAGAEVINSLSSESTDKALSAAMGKWLNENKLGKNDKAADSDKLDGHDSTYFATSADVQTAQRAANQGVNAAAAAHGRANEAYSRAEQAFTSASNGKIKIANAITGKGVPTSTTASWQEMAGNIGKIKGIRMGSIMANAGDNQDTGTIVTLPIDPSFIIFWMHPSGTPIAIRKISPGHYDGSLSLQQVDGTNVYLNSCVDVKYYSGTSFKLRPFDNFRGIASTKSGQVNWIAIE